MLLFSFLFGLAFAQSTPTTTNGVQEVIFGEVDVDGKRKKPNIGLSSSKGDPTWNPLTEVRTDFLEEMISSCDEL